MDSSDSDSNDSDEESKKGGVDSDKNSDEDDDDLATAMAKTHKPIDWAKECQIAVPGMRSGKDHAAFLKNESGNYL